MRDREESGGIRYSAVFGFILIIFAVLIILLASAQAKEIDKALRISEHYELYKTEKEADDTIAVEAALWRADGPAITKRSIERRGRDELHLAAESALQKITKDELLSGYISFIPEGAELRGISESDGYIFIDLSREMDNADERAFMQIEKSLRNSRDLREVVFLIEGEPIS